MADRKGAKATVIRVLRHPALWLLLVVAGVIGAGSTLVSCSGWDPREPFMRNAPEVDRAIEMIEAGEYASAEEALGTYLGTGPCSEGTLSLTDTVRKKSDGSFDLGLTLFYLAEQFGERFGTVPPIVPEGAPPDAAPDEQGEKRNLEIECAQIVVKAIAHDLKVPVELRARAHYLSGNLEFLRGEWETAAKAYDEALKLVPGIPKPAEGETTDRDLIGADAAWNRAIALRRQQQEEEQNQDEDQQDQEEDEQEKQEDQEGEEDDEEQEKDPNEDSDDQENQDEKENQDDESDEPKDDQEQENEDQKPEDQDQDQDQDQEDQSQDGEQDEEEQDSPNQPPPNDPSQDEPEDDPRDEDFEGPVDGDSQVDRLLDELEEAPSYQEEDAKRARRRRRRPVMEDK